MEAPFLRIIIFTASLTSIAASYRTTNFIVSAPTPQLAKKIGDAAEMYRNDLAERWLGQTLPPWNSPCPVTAQVGPHLGAGGATSFVFQNNTVGGWRMNIQGSEIRILDSVLPHEVTHTIFATHFRQPLPRWADEGACTTVEHPSEKKRHETMLISFLQTQRGIAFSQMLAMKEYPADVLPLYAEGYSLARYLIEEGGEKKFINFVGDGLQDDNWMRALHASYGVTDLGRLQNEWLEWVKQGSPNRSILAASKTENTLGKDLATMAVAQGRRSRPQPNLIHRPAGMKTDGLEKVAQNHPQPQAVQTAMDGWVAAGTHSQKTRGPFAPGSIASTNKSQPYQATRQQPVQPTRQTILR
jgi:hypothetical protein